jgi:hypothetical protein
VFVWLCVCVFACVCNVLVPVLARPQESHISEGCDEASVFRGLEGHPSCDGCFRTRRCARGPANSTTSTTWFSTCSSSRSCFGARRCALFFSRSCPLPCTAVPVFLCTVLSCPVLSCTALHCTAAVPATTAAPMQTVR